MSPPLTIPIRVRPGASRQRVGGAFGDPPALVVAVTSRAVDGKATEAALKAVADALDVPRRDVRLVTGATARTKVIALDDPPPHVGPRLQALLAPHGAGRNGAPR